MENITWGHALCRRSIMSMLLNTMPYGRWQPLGCQWHNKRPLVGGYPTHATRALSAGLSSPCLWHPEFPDHLTEEDPGFSQGIAGLCRGIWGQVRHPMWSCQGAPTMQGPIDDHQCGWCYGSLSAQACWGGIRTFAHSWRDCPSG